MAVNNLNPYLNFSQFLTGVAKRYQGQTFNGTTLAPIAPTNAKQGTYTVYGQEYRRADGDLRAIGAEAKQLSTSKSTDTFSCDMHSKAVPIFLDSTNAIIGQTVEQMREHAAFTCMETALLEREREIAALAASTASYTSGSTTHYAAASTKWDNASSTLMADIRAGCAKIRSATGRMPNKLFLPVSVQLGMATVAPFKDMLYNWGAGYQGSGPYGLPKYLPNFGIEIVSLESVVDTAGYGGSNVTISDVWSDNAILAYIDPNWMNKGTTFMSTFVYHDAQTGMNDVDMYEWLDERKNVDYVEYKQWRDVKVVDPLAGYLITDTLT